MKLIFMLPFFILFPISLNINRTQKQKEIKFKVIGTEKLKSHILYTVTNNNDTLIVISKPEMSKRKIENKLNNTNYKTCPTICELNDNGKKIVFNYKTGKTRTGCGSPGQEKIRYINSYKSLPIML